MPLSVPNSEFDASNRAHVSELILDIESDENVQRKKQAFILHECINGRQKDHVVDELKKLYPNSYANFRVSDISIAKKVVSKKAKAYKNPPTRKLEKDNETELLNEIYDKYHFDRVLKEADKIFNAYKYVGLWLSYIDPEEDSEELEGKYYLQALHPFEFDVLRHEKTGRVLASAFSYGDTDVTKGSDGIEQSIAEDQRDTAAQTKRYVIYDEKYKTIATVRTPIAGSEVKFSSFEVKPNKIKRVPLTFLSQDLAVDYPISQNLAHQSISWNVSFSDLRTAASTQGHGQLVISHPSGQKPKKLHMGMHHAINLPQSTKEGVPPTSAQYISANPNLAGQLDVLKFDLMNILEDHGISVSSSISGGIDNVKSGFDRLLKNADVQDIIEDNQSLYSDILEQGLFEQLIAYEEALNTARFRSERVEVFFEKPKVLISDSETLQNIKMREELGLLLPHEKHQILNPNLSDEQAKLREEEIQAIKEENIRRMASLMGEDEPEEEGEEDESEEV